MTELYTDWRNIPDSARGAIAALGNFDCVHLGHGICCARCTARGRTRGWEW